MVQQTVQAEQNYTQPNYIFPAKTGLISFRDAGYKNTSMAIAELIDNSIQAGAKKIRVLAFEVNNHEGIKTTRQVKKIAVFDDGEGMRPEVLSICLGFAQGTRLYKRKGIGRFGVGLPLASISQCKRTTVYSWQKEGEVFSTYLDINEVEENNQQYTNPVVRDKLPDDINNAIGKLKKETGTVVVWEDCDRLDLKRPETLLSRMEKGFCRIYRHFLDDNDNFAKLVDIKLISLSGDKSKEMAILPNDPLYLMTPNNLPGYENEATSISYEPAIKEKIEYAPGEFSEIEIHSSVMRREIGRWPPDGEHKAIRDHFRANVGISFVRACREIDFGVFNYFNPNELTERYWGIEVRFEPELDELFGVTNNKQNVRGIELLGKEEENDYDEDQYKNDYKLKLRKILSKKITNLLIGMRKEIANMAAKDRASSKNNHSTPGLDSSILASEVVKHDKTPTKTQIEAQNKSEAQKDIERENIIRDNDPSLTEEEVKSAAQELKDLAIAISVGSWPGLGFMTVQGAGDTAVAQLNRNHPFYNDLYLRIAKDETTEEAQALNLFLLAFVRAENEMYHDADTIEELREKWGAQLKKFLNAKKKV